MAPKKLELEVGRTYRLTLIDLPNGVRRKVTCVANEVGLLRGYKMAFWLLDRKTGRYREPTEQCGSAVVYQGERPGWIARIGDQNFRALVSPDEHELHNT